SARGPIPTVHLLILVRLPARLRLRTGLLQMNLLFNAVHPGERDNMMLTARLGVGLGELYLVLAFHVIHGSHVHAVGTDNLHVFLDHHRCNHTTLLVRELTFGANCRSGRVPRAPKPRPRAYPASAARIRAQLRMPLWKLVRSNF